MDGGEGVSNNKRPVVSYNKGVFRGTDQTIVTLWRHHDAFVYLRLPSKFENMEASRSKGF